MRNFGVQARAADEASHGQADRVSGSRASELRAAKKSWRCGGQNCKEIRKIARKRVRESHGEEDGNGGCQGAVLALWSSPRQPTQGPSKRTRNFYRPQPPPRRERDELKRMIAAGRSGKRAPAGPSRRLARWPLPASSRPSGAGGKRD